MECAYINLDGQAERRAAFEANFAQYKAPDWNLTRIAAVDGAQVLREAIPGKLRDTQKAVHFSHRKALTHLLAAPGHVLVFEDDALLGPQSAERIASAAVTLDHGAWDMIFTDISVPDAHMMARLFLLRRELAVSNEEMLLPLVEFAFSGTSCYLVHERFKPRLLELLQWNRVLDVPFDLSLREMMFRGDIRAFVTFPFVTSLSPLGDRSDNQLGTTAVTDTVWNAFRRMMWLHRDIDAAVAPVERLGTDFLDAETRAFLKVFGAAMSDKLLYK